MPSNQSGMRVKFVLMARTHDGERKNFWFDDRDDADAFLYALITGSLVYERELWRLPTPEWHPYFDGLIYEWFAVTEFLTSPTGSNQTWNRPADWNNANNSIQTIGAGASGGLRHSATKGHPTGGGGGAYNTATNVTADATETYQIGAGGALITQTGTTELIQNGNVGGDTWFGNTALAGSLCGSKGGTGGNSGTGSQNGGAGGVAASGVGSGSDGGRGGNLTGASGRGASGGGGAAGGSGAGNAGGDSTSTSDGTTTAGGAGNAGTGGGGTAGTAGAPATGGAGGNGTNFDATHGSGGGGGGGTDSTGTATGGAGGTYGGASGGAQVLAGASRTTTVNAASSGIIVIIYTPAAFTFFGTHQEFPQAHFKWNLVGY